MKPHPEATENVKVIRRMTICAVRTSPGPLAHPCLFESKSRIRMMAVRIQALNLLNSMGVQHRLTAVNHGRSDSKAFLAYNGL